jgi:hypothetical protein
MSVLMFIIGAVGGFIAGILVGRRNKNKVENTIDAFKKAQERAESLLKK